MPGRGFIDFYLDAGWKRKGDSLNSPGLCLNFGRFFVYHGSGHKILRKTGRTVAKNLLDLCSGICWKDLEFEGLSELLNRLFACKITISSIGTYVHMFLTSKSQCFGTDLVFFSGT